MGVQRETANFYLLLTQQGPCYADEEEAAV